PEALGTGAAATGFGRRQKPNWRAKPVFALMRLRRPHAEHTDAEARLLRRHASGAKTIVEIGVAEGASALELRTAMDPGGALYLIDPYHLGRFFGRSAAERVAHRQVRRGERGEVVWLTQFSQDAAR